MTRRLLLAVLALSLACGPSVANPRVKGLLPPKTELAWKVTRLHGFGPPNAVLALYRPEGGMAPLQGFVLGSCGAAIPLPKPQYPGWSMFEVQDAFAASAGKQNLLLVRADHVTGIGHTGARPFSVTRVFRGAGTALLERQDLDDRIGTLTSRAAIRRSIAGAK